MKFPAFEAIDLKNEDKIHVEEIALEQIIPDPEQPRKRFQAGAIEELSLSISKIGVIQPIIVQRRNDNLFTIIAGERRWRASKIAGLGAIPAIVKEVGRESVLGMQIVENLQRQELNVIELANAYSKLSVECSMSHDEIGRLVGKSRPHISNTIRLLLLSTLVQSYLVEGALEAGHAKALVSLSKGEQNQVAELAVRRNMTVREVEKLVKSLHKSPKEKSSVDVESNISASNVWAEEISKALQRPVTVKMNQRGGSKVEIIFNSNKDIEKFMAMISELSSVESA